jgi:hypothetical protein
MLLLSVDNARHAIGMTDLVKETVHATYSDTPTTVLQGDEG